MAASRRTNAFTLSRPFRGRCCGCEGYFCGQMTLPPTGRGDVGRHRWTVGGDRAIARIGRATATPDEIKNWVPQLYYAEVAESIRQQEGDDFAYRKIWLSVCSGSKSDRLPAMAAKYRYLPVDVRRLVRSFGGVEPNEPLDMTVDDLYDYIVRLLGGESELLNIAVVSSSIPCETHTQMNPGKHRDLDTGDPHPGPRGARAREVDLIEANFQRFLTKLLELRAGGSNRCTCSRRDG